MMKTLLCDDEGPARELLADILNSAKSVELIAVCSSAKEALRIINRGGVDLVFFDIEMPEMSGVEAARKLTVEHRPLIVFATAHADYAIDAFGIDAIDYILKPIDPDRVLKAVEKANRLHHLIDKTRGESGLAAEGLKSAPTDEALRVFDAGRLFVIPYKEIVWVEAAGDYSLIHRLEGETAIRRTLSSVIRELPGNRFKRVHRSAIVSVSHITEIKRLAKGEAELTLNGEVMLRASRTYRTVIDELMS